MPGHTTYSFPAGSDMQRFLNQLASDMGSRDAARPLVRAIQEVSTPVRQQMRANTPRRTGELRRSVRSRPLPPRRGRGGGVSANVFTGWIVSGQRGRNWKVRLAVEYGTSRQPAQRALNRAWESKESEINRNLGEAVERHIADTAVRLGRGYRRLSVRR